MTVLLELEGLVAGYRRPVAGPLTLTLAEGEVIGLWGTNGSGKTTLLRAITGAARVFGGCIRRSEGLTLIHHAQQGPALDGIPLTGQELCRIAGASAAPPAPLDGWSVGRLDALSGGQRQLLRVWACLSGTARLLLLDEPTNNLDPQALDLLARLLSEQRPGRGVLLISHERAFLERVCNRIENLTTWH